jgi:hypothetical protein
MTDPRQPKSGDRATELAELERLRTRLRVVSVAGDAKSLRAMGGGYAKGERRN